MATHFLAMWSLACNFFGSFGWGSCLPSFFFFFFLLLLLGRKLVFVCNFFICSIKSFLIQKKFFQLY